MSQASLVDFLINNQPIRQSPKTHTTSKRGQSFRQDKNKIIRNFFRILASYGLAPGKQSIEDELEELINKVEGVGKDSVLSTKQNKGGEYLRDNNN
jgi:hypothetical protein